MGEPRGKVVDEGGCRRPVTAPYGPRGNELGVGINRDPRPHVPDGANHALHPLGHVLGLGVDEGPNLVALNPLHLEIAERLILEPLTCGAHVQQELGDGVDGHVGHAAGGAEAVALHQHPED
jgi:hypothetical protein